MPSRAERSSASIPDPRRSMLTGLGVAPEDVAREISKGKVITSAPA